MDTTNTQLTVPHSSSLPRWDVFLSFYGKDTRRNFIAHLYFALDQAGILTFRDDPALEKGEEISSGLLKAIKDSKMFVVVLSEKYARSPRCLNELVEILSCNRTGNQVIPVFYHVDPSDLRHHKGAFGEALDYHGKRYSVDMIEKWKSALAKIAQLSGYHLKKDADENESNTLQEIVENVVEQTSTGALHLEEYLVGINSAVEEIYQKLSMESNDVRAIGICGMGGIGKTTTAKYFYNKYSNTYDVSCFIENIEQFSQGGTPLLSFLEQLLIGLLRRKDYAVKNVETGIKQLERILSAKKALIVLDDLHPSIYSEFFARRGYLFSAESRIIITTRDSNLLTQLRVDISQVDIYMVKELGDIDSLKLFSYHAFREPKPPESFRELTVRFATYAGGVPLALKVLGSSLRGRTQESFWKAKLEKVRKIPNKDIQEILQLSYDELDETEKSIFLDIAFFFVGKDKDEAVHIFDSCDYFPDAGIPILVERCLLTIDENNNFRMHNLIQDMGCKLGKSRGLFWRGALEEMQSVEPSKQLSNLCHLELQNCRYLNQLPEQLGIMKALKVIDASETAIQKLPDSIVQLKKLVKLQLRNCFKLEILPKQFGDLEGLRTFDASYSAIRILPDSFVALNRLAELNMTGCANLRKLPNFFGRMSNLEHLRLYGCTNITSLPNSTWKLRSLRVLNMEWCSKLKRLPEQIGKMLCLEEIHAHWTGIQKLPHSIGLLSKLKVLEVDGYDITSLQYVPSSIWNLTSLTELNLVQQENDPSSTLASPRLMAALKKDIIDLTGAAKIMKLKELSVRCNMRLWLPLIQGLSSLEMLYLVDDGQSVSSTQPLNLSKLYNLEDLTILDCTSIGTSILKIPMNLKYLRLFNYTTLEQLPDLSSLKQLKDLDIGRCINIQSLPQLPPHLEELKVDECASLQDVTELSMLKQLRNVSISRCSTLKSVNIQETSPMVGEFYTFHAALPNREVAEWFSYKSWHTVSFDIPLSLGENFLGLAFWVVSKCICCDASSVITAVITNETNGIRSHRTIGTPDVIVGEVQSVVESIRGEDISLKSGDNVNVRFHQENGMGEVESCGVHVIQKIQTSAGAGQLFPTPTIPDKLDPSEYRKRVRRSKPRFSFIP
ncbi:hypothetical protein AgCh_034087 [Apium graveolens]